MRFLGAAALLLVFLVGVSSAEPALQVREKFPVRGEETEIVVTGFEAERLEFVYQPDAPIAKRVPREVAGAGQKILWTPERAGIVRIEAFRAGEDMPAAVHELSVAFPGPPAASLLIAIVAGSVLFGGVAFTLRGLLSEN